MKTQAADMPATLCYCKSCGDHNSWSHNPARDIKSESGITLWLAYKCRVCGAKTIRMCEE